MTTRRIAVLVVLFLFLSLIACGEDENRDQNHNHNAPPDDELILDDDDQSSAEECDSGDSFTFELLGDRNIPYPSMLNLRPDFNSVTGFRVDISGPVTAFLEPILSKTDRFLDELNNLTGFGVASPIWFHVNTPPIAMTDENGNVPDDAVFCAVLAEPSSPHYGEIRPVDVEYIPDVQLVQVLPHLPLEQNTTYACVITDAVRSASGGCYEQPDELAYVMSPVAHFDHPQSAELEPYRQQLAPYFSMLFEQYDIEPTNVLAATIFHTQNITHDLERIRAKLEKFAQENPPTINGWTRIDSRHPDVDSVWETTYRTIDWQKGGEFVYDETGDPLPVSTSEVTLRFTLPKDGVNGHHAPFPVAIYGHGLLYNRNQCVHFAQTLAGQGFATVAIDWVRHGERRPLIAEWFPGVGYIVRFFTFTPVLRPQEMRDNFRQGIADMIWLKHVIRGLKHFEIASLLPGGESRIVDLDTDFIAYMGMSMGASHGMILSAVEPEIDTYALMSGAANWRAGVFSNNYEGMMVLFVDFSLGVIDDLFKFERPSDTKLFYSMLLTVSEAGDPYSYSPYILDEPRFVRPSGHTNILHQMAASDGIIGGLGGAELARSLGLTLLQPFVWQIDEVPLGDTPFFGPATYQYDTGDHTFMNQINNQYFEASQYQLGVFMRSAYDDGIAAIVDPFEQ